MEQGNMSNARRWSAMVGALLICLCAGFGYAWSVIQTPIAQLHGWLSAQVSMTYPITVACSTMSPLLFGSLVRKLGTRRCMIFGSLLFGSGLILCSYMTAVWQLYLCYGVMTGLGVGFIYPTLMSYVVQLFPERPGMASGLGTAFYGSGAILWAPAMVSMIHSRTLSGAFRLMGALFLAVILLCSLFIHKLSAAGKKDAAQGDGLAASGLDLCRKQMVRTPNFYFMVAVFTCALVAGTMVISQASPILQDMLGSTAAQAAVFVSAFSACNTCGRFVWGGLSDKLGLKLVMKVEFLLCILSMAALAFGHSRLIILVSMGVAASCYGGFAAILTPMTAWVFGPKYIGENYGVMYVVFGLASLIGPGLISLCTAAALGYKGAFLTATVLSVAGLAGTRFLKSLIKQPDERRAS